MVEQRDVLFLHFEQGDWERLEIDGERVFNNHSLKPWELLDSLDEHDLLKDNVNLDIDISYDPEQDS